MSEDRIITDSKTSVGSTGYLLHVTHYSTCWLPGLKKYNIKIGISYAIYLLIIILLMINELIL